MSYDLRLIDPVTEETLELDSPHHMKGGTYALGGTCLAKLNVTYNYLHFYSSMGGNELRTIEGMSGADSIPLLTATANLLGNDVSNNYWEATEGNAKQALLQLIALAKMRPDGVWKIS